MMADDAPAVGRSHQHVRCNRRAARAFVTGAQMLDGALHREADRFDKHRLV